MAFTCSVIKAHFLIFHPQNLDIQVEDVRIRAILSSYRKRIPVTEGYVEVKDGGKWKQICNTEWTQLSSRVICGMFGFPGERRYNARVYKWVFHYYTVCVVLGNWVVLKQCGPPVECCEPVGLLLPPNIHSPFSSSLVSTNCSAAKCLHYAHQVIVLSVCCSVLGRRVHQTSFHLYQ